MPQMWWFGAVKYVFQSTLTAGCCYLLNYVTMSAQSKPSVNRCLPRLSESVPGEKGRQEEWQSQPWPSSPSQQDAGNSSSRALQRQAVDAGSVWWRDSGQGGQSPPGVGVPAQLLCTFKYLLHNSTLCGSAKTTQQLCSTDKNRIQVFKLRSGGAFHLMSVRPVLGHVCWWKDHGQIDSNKSQPLLSGLKC